MKHSILLFFALIAASLSEAGTSDNYREHIATDRIIVIFDHTVSVADQETLIKNSGLVTDHLNVPHPRLTICYTRDIQAAQNYFKSLAEVSFVSFFITDGKGHYGGVLNDFFVKLIDKSFEPELQAALKANHLGIAVPDTYIPNLYKVVNTQYRVNNTIEWCARLQSESWVAYASPNYLLNPMVNSNDPLYGYEWQVHNAGTAMQGSGTVGADMSVDLAWAVTTGDSTIKIGLLDSGTDTTHPDLKQNLLPGHDAVGDSTNGYPTPHYAEDGHGTCTAGIMVAVKDNGIGVAGIAPSCRVIPVRSFYYLSAQGQTQPFSTGDIFAAAIGWASDTGHADILSNSWALPPSLVAFLPGGTQPVEDALLRAYTHGRNGKGIAIFFSSGNLDDSIGPLWPGYLPQCISVNATNQCDTRKSTHDCSHDAWGSDYGPGLEISAPGENVPSTDMIGSNGFSSGDYYLTFSGTSASCPCAAAVGALVLSVNHQFRAADVRNIIDQTCDKVGGYGYDSTYANGSWCRELGYGRVNAYQAVTVAQTYTPTTAIQSVKGDLGISIYPNPGRDLINIQYPGSETAVMKLYDLTGNLVASHPLHQGLNTADISLLSDGVYLARIDSPTASSVRKLVVCR
jgi:subtilisin family serine protease